MSNNPLQRIADLEAQLADMTAEKEELKQQPSATKPVDAEGLAAAIAEVIDARLIKTEQHLREDFVGKFAAFFEPIIERTTSRAVALEKRLDEAGAGQGALEQRLRTHLDEIDARFAEMNGEQDARLTRFSKTLENHHAKNDAALALLQQYVQTCRALALATAGAVEACQGFKRDYEETVAKAEGDRTALAKRVEGELTAFAREIRRRLQDAVESALKDAERRARSTFRRQVEFVGALALGAIFLFGLLWMASPDGSAALDAARWRRWQGGFTQGQAERLNKVLEEIDKEDQFRAQEHPGK